MMTLTKNLRGPLHAIMSQVVTLPASARWVFTGARFTGAIIVLLLTGCATWYRVEPLPSKDLPGFRQYRVWAGDSAMVLRGVQISHDSLSGVPASDAIECPTCRIAFPLAQVDSIATEKTEGVGAGVLGVGAGGILALILFGLILAASGGRT
jgi:hypothetical protein